MIDEGLKRGDIIVKPIRSTGRLPYCHSRDSSGVQPIHEL